MQDHHDPQRRRQEGDRTTSNSNAPAGVSTSFPFRGFSTSIANLTYEPLRSAAGEQSHNDDRINFCSVFCVGILQNDRDRFLIQGIVPPSLLRRFFLHIVFPVTVFVVACVEAAHIPNPVLNEIVSYASLLLLLSYGFYQLYRGRQKRIQVRYDLLQTRYQTTSAQQNQESSSNHHHRNSTIGRVLMRRQQEMEEADCSTTATTSSSETRDALQGQTLADMHAAHPCCIIGCYPQDSEEYPACCFGYHPQICGICALAQEGREIERFLPSPYYRIDYITMQSYSTYYPQIYQAKHQQYNEQSSPSLLPPLSRLSKRLLQMVFSLFAFLLVWCFLNSSLWRSILRRQIPHHSFHYTDWVIFILVWLQATVLVCIARYLVHAYNQSRGRSSLLSLDAIIKYVASGCCIATIMAVFGELAIGLVFKAFIFLVLAICGIEMVDDPDTQNAASFLGGGQSGQRLYSIFASSIPTSVSFIDTFGLDHPVFYAIYIFVQAFVVAAGVEEFCKYAAYRMVEHPDFLSRAEIEQAMSVIYGQDEEEIEEGRRQRSSRVDFSKQRESLQEYAAAITLAMVCVAIGFTLCENLVYVFIYSGNSPMMELYVLIARSLFPIHPIVAGIQSIGVVRRDVERDASFGLKRIIFPALVFHGGYDFFLLFLDYLTKRHGTFVDANDDDSILDGFTVATSTASWLISFAFMFGALFYLYRKSRQQRERLMHLDTRNAALL